MRFRITKNSNPENGERDLVNRGGTRNVSDPKTKDEDRGWMIPLNESPKFNYVVDMLTKYINEIEELPFAILSIVVEAARQNLMRDVRTPDDEEELRMLYLLMGMFLHQKNGLLVFKDSDVDKIQKLTERLRLDISLQELVMKGVITPIIRSGDWTYKLTPEQEKAVDKFLEEKTSRKA